MTTVYFVRHAQSDASVQDPSCGLLRNRACGTGVWLRNS